MRYETRVTAFDMLDQVHVVVATYAKSDVDVGPSRLAWSCTTTVRGTGEPDPIRWTRDALVAALECT